MIRRDQRRCARCRYDWRPGLPLRLAWHQWQVLLRCHLRGLSAVAIAEETGLHRQRVLRVLTRVRQAMQQEVPPVFRGTVEVDETYLGGVWRNRRGGQRARGGKRGRGTSKTPVFGILCRAGAVWAQVVPDLAAKTLLPLIRRQVQPGSVVCSDTLPTYTGIAAKGYVHRLVQHDQGEHVSRHGTHINGLEGFWGGTSNAGWPLRGGFAERGCRSMSQTTCGGTTIAVSRSMTRSNAYSSYSKNLKSLVAKVRLYPKEIPSVKADPNGPRRLVNSEVSSHHWRSTMGETPPTENPTPVCCPPHFASE